jgi:hypothetical protein
VLVVNAVIALVGIWLEGIDALCKGLKWVWDAGEISILVVRIGHESSRDGGRSFSGGRGALHRASISLSRRLGTRCLSALIISISGGHNLLRAVSCAVLLAVILSRRVLTAPAAPGKKSGGSSRG